MVVLFCFVDIGRIVDDHSLTFLFIIMSPLLPLLLLLSKACPYHNFFVFRDRSMIFGMWVHSVMTSWSNNSFFYIVSLVMGRHKF